MFDYGEKSPKDMSKKELSLLLNMIIDYKIAGSKGEIAHPNSCIEQLLIRYDLLNYK